MSGSDVAYFKSNAVADAFKAGAVLFDGKGANYQVHASRRVQPGQAEVHTGVAAGIEDRRFRCLAAALFGGDGKPFLGTAADAPHGPDENGPGGGFFTARHERSNTWNQGDIRWVRTRGPSAERPRGTVTDRCGRSAGLGDNLTPKAPEFKRL